MTKSIMGRFRRRPVHMRVHWRQIISNDFTATFSCVFLNCNNVFEIGARRGPRTAAGLQQKIENLAGTLRAANGGKPPDIVGLCEVSTLPLVERIAEAVAPNVYHALWSGVSTSREGRDGGLAVLHRPEIITSTALEVDNNNPAQRPKWMAALFQLQVGTRGGFWFVVNHWKSQMGGEVATEPSRMITAQQIGEFYLNQARINADSMVLMGDFNCQPGDRPFRQQALNKLRAVRERALVIRDRNRLAYFYNPLWRWLGEPDDFDTTQRGGYVPSRLMGTHLPRGSKHGWYVWDQILVTKPLIVGDLIHFQEETVHVHQAQSRCSDHCAVAATFQC